MSVQLGHCLALYIANEHNRDIFDISATIFLCAFPPIFLNVFLITFLFCFVIYPLDPTSNVHTSHAVPLSCMSFLSCLYLDLFLYSAASALLSKGTVSSIKVTFERQSSIITRSGLWGVAWISWGMVPPLMSYPSRSAYTEILLSFLVRMFWMM